METGISICRFGYRNLSVSLDFCRVFFKEFDPQGLTRYALCGILSKKNMMGENGMMSTKMKLRSVGCNVSDIISACTPLAAEVARFASDEYAFLPGFCDVHVHFREPGFSYKETIETGSKASARGGYTAVCTMPNLNPVPDSVENLQLQRKLIEEQAVIHVYPYGAITVGEKGETLADLEGMANDVIGFSDDGRGVQSDDKMREAMIRAKALGKMIVAHCEVNELLRGGYIHDGQYAKAHGHKGICSASEYEQIERDLKLVEQIGCKYHVCHISTKESVELIRQAKARGVDVTAKDCSRNHRGIQPKATP